MTDSDMVRKVAGALKSKLMEIRFRTDEVSYEEIARAAIEAMREPTEAMCRAGEQPHALAASTIYRLMIDAALNTHSELKG